MSTAAPLSYVFCSRLKEPISDLGTLLILVLWAITFFDEIYIHSVLLVKDSRNMGNL